MTWIGLTLYPTHQSISCVAVACVGGYEQMEDTQYFGATKDGATTVADCQTACNDAGSNCAGFGFNTNNNECWIHAQVNHRHTL